MITITMVMIMHDHGHHRHHHHKQDYHHSYHRHRHRGATTVPKPDNKVDRQMFQGTLKISLSAVKQLYVLSILIKLTVVGSEGE